MVVGISRSRLSSCRRWSRRDSRHGPSRRANVGCRDEKPPFRPDSTTLFAQPWSPLMLVAAPMPAAARHAEMAMTLMEGGFSSPLQVVNAGDSRLFVVEKGGLIKIIGGGTFLDLSGEGEHRLANVACWRSPFHPNYAASGLFYVDVHPRRRRRDARRSSSDRRATPTLPIRTQSGICCASSTRPPRTTTAGR